MTLVRWNNTWLLAVRADSASASCSIIGGDWPWLRDHGFQEHVVQMNCNSPVRTWWKACVSLNALTFFPEVRWHGFRVTPMFWEKGATKPLLRCSIGPFTQKDIPPGIEQFTDYLRAHGWAWSPRDFMGERTVHVDELEKIEGPPPEGAF